MKKVTQNKRRFGKKDILSWSFITLGHCLFFAAYILVLLTIRHYVKDEYFWPKTSGENLLISFTLLIGPVINGILHIVYDEIGSPWTRFAMFVNSLANISWIPIMIFIFL